MIIRIPSILRCFESGQYYFAPTTQWLIDLLARYLAILNSSINFFIYCLVGTEFRATLLTMFGLKKNPDIPHINVEQVCTQRLPSVRVTEPKSSWLRIGSPRSEASSSSISSQSESCLSVASHVTDADLVSTSMEHADTTT